MPIRLLTDKLKELTGDRGFVQVKFFKARKKYGIIEYEFTGNGRVEKLQQHLPHIVETGPKWKLDLSLADWAKTKPVYSSLGFHGYLDGLAEIWWTWQHRTRREIVEIGKLDCGCAGCR